MSVIRATNAASGRGLLEETFIGDFGVSDDAAVERTVEAVPAGRTIKDAWLTVKTLPTDADASAIFQKAITSVLTSAGQITDTGADGVGVVRFLLTEANTGAIADSKFYDIQVGLDNSETYTLERGRIKALRPVINTAVGTRNGRGFIRQVSSEPTTRASQFPQRNEIIDDAVAGDDFAIERYLDGLTGALTVASARLTARAAPADADPGLFQVAITTSATASGQILDAGSGSPRTARLRFVLTRVQTLLLSTPRAFDIEVTLSDGKVYTPMFGTLYAPAGVSVAEGSGGGGGGGDDVATLIALLGTDTNVPFFHDVRYGIATSAGVVDSWADKRGAGFGLTLNGSGTERPAWDATNLLITFDGVNDRLYTLADAMYALDGIKTLIIVTNAPTADGYLGAIADGTAANRLMGMVRTGGNNIVGRFFPGNTEANSGVLGSATRRVNIVSKNATTGGKVEVPNVAGGTVAITAIPSGNNRLTIGAYAHDAGGSFSGTTVRAVLGMNTEPTAQQVTDIRDWAVANHAAVFA